MFTFVFEVLSGWQHNVTNWHDNLVIVDVSYLINPLVIQETSVTETEFDLLNNNSYVKSVNDSELL